VQTAVLTAVDAVVSAPHTAFNFVLGGMPIGLGFSPVMQPAATNRRFRISRGILH
jgi:hypothetical protein